MIDWSTVGVFFMIIGLGELLATLVFWVIVRGFKKDKISGRGLFRGFLERFFIYFGMVNGVFHALTLFGALKIATHIKDDDKVTNDYFLIGNLISVFFAMSYFLIYQSITSL